MARVGSAECGLAALASYVLRDASVGRASLVWAVGEWRMPRMAYYLGEVGCSSRRIGSRGGVSRHFYRFLDPVLTKFVL